MKTLDVRLEVLDYLFDWANAQLEELDRNDILTPEHKMVWFNVLHSLKYQIAYKYRDIKEYQPILEGYKQSEAGQIICKRGHKYTKYLIGCPICDEIDGGKKHGNEKDID